MKDWHKKKGTCFITSGTGYGSTELAAFDAAELDAGIIAVNAIKVTSFIPPGWKVSTDEKKFKRFLDKGQFQMMVYSFSASKTKKAFAALAMGVPKDKSKSCILMEHNQVGGSLKGIRSAVISQAEEVFSFRKWKLKEIREFIAEAKPKKGKVAGALVAVVYFPGL